MSSDPRSVIRKVLSTEKGTVLRETLRRAVGRDRRAWDDGAGEVVEAAAGGVPATRAAPGTVEEEPGSAGARRDSRA